MAIQTEEYKGATISIEQDEFEENPRDWQLGTIISMKDVANQVSREAFQDIREKVNKGVSPKTAIKHWYPDVAFILPLYTYEHGAITFALHTNFPDFRWDGGWTGFIFVTRQELRNWFSRERLSASLVQKITDQLANDLEYFSDWVNGWIYAFMVEDSGIEDLDGVWYGGYNSTAEAMDNAKAMIDDYREREPA